MKESTVFDLHPRYLPEFIPHHDAGRAQVSRGQIYRFMPASGADSKEPKYFYCKQKPNRLYSLS